MIMFLINFLYKLKGCKSRASRSVRHSYKIKLYIRKKYFTYSIFSKDVRLPVQMQRAMATEAEATREARAKVIAAEGEQKASIALKEASDVINQSPVALQLRYLQTLTHIAAEKNSTIVFPIPIELLRALPGANKH